jgi:signal transduction histidine kinase
MVLSEAHQRGWTPYILAMIIPAISFVVRLELLEAIGNSLPYVTFFPAVIIAALYGGLPAGLVATAISAMLISYFILDSHSFILTSNDRLGMFVFLFSCLLSSYCCEAIHRAKANLQQRTAELIDANCKLQKEFIEREQFEQALLNLDRLNLVGQMAASMGHEIRNPMTTVRGYLQVLKRKQEYQEQSDIFELMIEELDRANSIITEYLSLAKDKHVELESHDLNHLVETMYPLLQADANERGHTVYLQLNPIPDIQLDEKEIRQAIINIVRNSIEAIDKNGSIYISTYREANDIVLAIQDNGPGMPAAVLEALGTPFMTTKANGNGLGISVCYQIFQRHKAKFKVLSNSDGTTLIVRFKEEIEGIA